MKRSIALVLVHYPIVDSAGAVVTTAITNLDIHDIARSARTYGCTDYVIVHPIEAQRELVRRICTHWAEGSSGKRIPSRKEALAIVRIADSLDAAFGLFGGRDAVEVWVTAARDVAPPLSHREARARVESTGKPIVIVFGTGWGLAPSVIAASDQALAPIRVAGTDYNHLSVRAAAAITLDRLLGE